MTSYLNIVAFKRCAAPVLKRALCAINRPANLGAEKAHLALGLEAVVEEHIALNLDAIAVECRASGVLKRALCAINRPANLGSRKVHLALGRKAVVEQHIARNLDAVAIHPEDITTAQDKSTERSVATDQAAIDAAAEQTKCAHISSTFKID